MKRNSVEYNTLDTSDPSIDFIGLLSQSPEIGPQLEYVRLLLVRFQGRAWEEIGYIVVDHRETIACGPAPRQKLSQYITEIVWLFTPRGFLELPLESTQYPHQPI